MGLRSELGSRQWHGRGHGHGSEDGKGYGRRQQGEMCGLRVRADGRPEDGLDVSSGRQHGGGGRAGAGRPLPRTTAGGGNDRNRVVRWLARCGCLSGRERRTKTGKEDQTGGCGLAVSLADRSEARLARDTRVTVTCRSASPGQAWRRRRQRVGLWGARQGAPPGRERAPGGEPAARAGRLSLCLHACGCRPRNGAADQSGGYTAL